MVWLKGAKGSKRPDQLKLCIGLKEGYLSEQLFYFSYPNALQKVKSFEKAAKEISAGKELSAVEVKKAREEADATKKKIAEDIELAKTKAQTELDKIQLEISKRIEEAKQKTDELKAIWEELNGNPNPVSFVLAKESVSDFYNRTLQTNIGTKVFDLQHDYVDLSLQLPKYS